MCAIYIYVIYIAIYIYVIYIVIYIAHTNDGLCARTHTPFTLACTVMPLSVGASPPFEKIKVSATRSPDKKLRLKKDRVRGADSQ